MAFGDCPEAEHASASGLASYGARIRFVGTVTGAVLLKLRTSVRIVPAPRIPAEIERFLPSITAMSPAYRRLAASLRRPSARVSPPYRVSTALDRATPAEQADSSSLAPRLSQLPGRAVWRVRIFGALTESVETRDARARFLGGTLPRANMNADGAPTGAERR